MLILSLFEFFHFQISYEFHNKGVTEFEGPEVAPHSLLLFHLEKRYQNLRLTQLNARLK